MFLVALGLGCNSDNGTKSDDTTPPAAIGNLSAGGVSFNSVTLLWTAPGDDDTVGTASSYDIRYSSSEITETSWGGATRAASPPVPQKAGTSDYFTVVGLDPLTTYHFAIKTSDEANNQSAISNDATVETAPPPDHIPPSPIIDLGAVDVTSLSITLVWTATGDDGDSGSASHYDIRYSSSLITESNFGDAAEIDGEPTPKPAGQKDSMVVRLQPNTTYYFMIRAADEAFNWSPLSNLMSAHTDLAEAIPPAAVTDLTVDSVSYNKVYLHWTATGDDGLVGNATLYDLRRSFGFLTADNFSQGTRVNGVPAPHAPGTMENFTVTKLASDSNFYFAIKVGDEVPNFSEISNVVLTHTLVAPDVTAPSPIVDLRATDSTRTTVTLEWLASGDDNVTGTASEYDLRYAQFEITSANWTLATRVSGVPHPRVAATSELYVVRNLKANTLYWFAIKVSDEIPNTSPLSNVVTKHTGQ